MTNQDKIALLKDLVAINTVANHEKTVATYLHDYFKQHGIESKLVDVTPDRANLIAEIGDGNGPVLAFSGHIDTVHEGDVTTWDSDPFTLTAHDGKLFGRGATDMKGGLADFIMAFVSLHDSDEPLHGTLRFIATADEEKNELGADKLAADGYLDDIDAVIIGEPTGVALDEISEYFTSGGAVIDSKTLKTLQKAVATSKALEQHFIFFAHKGFLAYDVTATGKAAHSSMPKLGVDAINHLIKYYQAEEALYDALPEESPIMAKTMRGANIIRGGSQQNSVPDSATLTELTRTIPELPAEKLIERLQALITKLDNEDETMNLSLHVNAYDDAIVTPQDSELIKLVQSVVPKYLDEPMVAPTIAVSLGTDAAAFVNANPNVQLAIFGPGNTTAHKANEYVEEQAYFAMVDIYQEVAKKYLQ
ncbi:M20/M25/M40 family metallo-hydrolase [Weissella bombi]|uniref:Succinyl-diaminopimelate desuccinylase n=1 Tax=Weissella bombi TaxID=1505725 RepID=A0A1C4BM93_9LACO|nr:M20/M25/M40 family metallo-hydrolase [Weissella bombi]SCC07923.1 succinyl-diaminopimelate desuccinylase [Weissella bombi]